MIIRMSSQRWNCGITDPVSWVWTLSWQQNKRTGDRRLYIEMGLGAFWRVYPHVIEYSRQTLKIAPVSRQFVHTDSLLEDIWPPPATVIGLHSAARCSICKQSCRE